MLSDLDINFSLQFVFSVMIDGEETWTKTNSQAEQFSNVAIFAGDGWRDPQPGKIKSFRVKTLLD